MNRKLLGRIAPEKVRLLETPPPPPGLLEGFRALGDASATVSDVLDELGLEGAVPATRLKPCMPGQRLAGVAITLRNEPETGEFREKAVRGAPMGMHDVVAHRLAVPGNVLVIQGVPNVSNLGGLSCRVGKRQGEAGAIVDGGVRDVADFKAAGYPVWAAGITPVSGRWRISTAEINGTVEIAGITVRPGDVVVADDAGIVFVPQARATEVLELCRRKQALDEARSEAIERGDSIESLFAAGRRAT